MAGKIVGSYLVIQMAQWRAGLLVGAKVRLATAIAGGAVVPTTAIGDFTQAAWAGYAQQTPTWSAPVLNGASTHAPITGTTVFFGNTSGGNVTAVGYYLVDVNGDLIGGEAFGAAIVAPNGVSIAITPTIDNVSEF